MCCVALILSFGVTIIRTLHTKRLKTERKPRVILFSSARLFFYEAITCFSPRFCPFFVRRHRGGRSGSVFERPAPKLSLSRIPTVINKRKFYLTIQNSSWTATYTVFRGLASSNARRSMRKTLRPSIEEKLGIPQKSIPPENRHATESSTSLRGPPPNFVLMAMTTATAGRDLQVP